MDLNVERWYSMKEICEYLGVSRDTRHKNRQAVEIQISEVDAWMKSGVAAEK